MSMRAVRKVSATSLERSEISQSKIIGLLKQAKSASTCLASGIAFPSCSVSDSLTAQGPRVILSLDIVIFVSGSGDELEEESGCDQAW